MSKENIWQHLGLHKDHRKGKAITQHVKHISEVPESKKSWPMYGQIKKDGCYALVVETKNETAIFSRTGKRYTNLTRLEAEINCIAFDKGMYKAIYIAEVCNDQCSLESLSGMINPNRKKGLTWEQEDLMTQTYLSYYDVIPITSFVAGHCSLSYEDRYTWLKNHLPHQFDLLELCVLMNQEQADVFFNDAIAEGEEGVVFKQCAEGMSDWKAGHKGYRQMKKVRGVDYDLLCIGAEEGKGKYKGLVANLIFQWKKGKIIKCMLGKGWTHKMAENMWDCVGHSSDPAGRIFQVYALQESSKGKLRLPKVGEVRHDKSEPDV